MMQIIDNFYSSTDKLLALSESCFIGGCGYGEKSEDLSVLDPDFYQEFKHFLFSQYNLNETHHLTTYLTKHTFNPDGILGRIHIDGRNPHSCVTTPDKYDLVFCGIVFLSPCKDLNSGISFYDVKPEIQWNKQQEFNITLNECYSYDQNQLNEYHQKFDETLNIKNKQNRFVSWPAGMKHKTNMTEKQNVRVIQNFFISVV
jgi:hypothetical protein